MRSAKPRRDTLPRCSALNERQDSRLHGVEPIVMQPMPGIIDHHLLAVLEVLEGVVLADSVRITLARIDEQHWTLDALPQGNRVVIGKVMRGTRVCVVVELPAERSVLVLATAMYRKVARPFGC